MATSGKPVDTTDQDAEDEAPALPDEQDEAGFTDEGNMGMSSGDSR